MPDTLLLMVLSTLALLSASEEAGTTTSALELVSLTASTSEIFGEGATGVLTGRNSDKSPASRTACSQETSIRSRPELGLAEL